MTKPKFPLEKILNISIDDYCSAVGKKKTDYILYGVHAVGLKCEEPIEKLRTLIPANAEVVVSLKYAIGGAGHSHKYVFADRANGVALIPRKK